MTSHRLPNERTPLSGRPVDNIGVVDDTFQSEPEPFEQDDIDDDSNNNDDGMILKYDYCTPDHLTNVPSWLLPCHLVSAIFHYLQAFILFSFAGNDNQTKWPIYTNFPSQHITNPDIYGTPVSEQSGTANLAAYGAIYLLLSGMYHTIAIIPCVRPQYEYYISRCQSPYRWIDHSISEGLMKMVVGMIVGISDAHLLFSIFMLISNGIIFKYVHEQMNAKARQDSYQQIYTSFYMSFVPLITCWIVLLMYYSQIADTVKASDEVIPTNYISTIVGLMLVFDIVHSMIFILQWKSVNVFVDYAFGEFCFILLSFTSKTFLAWISYGAAITGY